MEKKLGIIMFILLVIILVTITILFKCFKTESIINNNSASNIDTDSNLNKMNDNYRKEMNKIEKNLLELSN